MNNRLFARFPFFAGLSLVLIAMGWLSPNVKAQSSAGVTIVVSSNADSGAGTLRQAITTANTNGTTTADTIAFRLPGGSTTITVTSALPAITKTVLINGYTQSGTQENQIVTGGTNATPAVQLAGDLTSNVPIGLDITGDLIYVRGLVIRNFTTGVHLGGSNSAVGGCFIGTNVTGTAASANGTGVSLDGSNDRIGGTFTVGTTTTSTTQNRNVISGNTVAGISVQNTGGTVNILGNLVGTNAVGNGAIANNVGIAVGNVNSVQIGSSSFGTDNTISGNTGAGIQANAGNALTIQGNSVGIGTDGTTAVGNGTSGISIIGSSNCQIGGNSAQANVVSGNGLDGISLNGASDSRVSNNRVGTDFQGSNAVPNAQAGIHVTSGSRNVIGRQATDNFGNLVSGNGVNGIWIEGSFSTQAVGNIVTANFVGVNLQGAALGNGTNGIAVSADTTGTIIGGTAANDRNYIAANGSAGILLEDNSTTTTVLNNYIGTDSGGMASLANGTDGIRITSSGNTVGNAAGTGRNVISGNTGAGVSISGANNTLIGNYIGTNLNGALLLGSTKQGTGVAIDGSGATGNLVTGGATAATRCIISGNNEANSGYGVYISGGASTNSVTGCYIGTNAAGSAAVRNNRGVVIDNASSNTIGGLTVAARNVISGSEYGVLVANGNSRSNLIQGNYIGTNAAGSGAVANDYGVALFSGAVSTTIGENNTGRANAGNLVSGNTNNNILLQNCDVATIIGNKIGTRADGLAALGNFTTTAGIGLGGGARNCTIGGTVAGLANTISGNAGNGIYLMDSGTRANRIIGNYIGVGSNGTTPVPNNNSGVVFHEGAQDNNVGLDMANTGNIIANNGGDGVAIYGLISTGSNEANGNGIRRNSMYNNGGLGINLRTATELDNVANVNDAGDGDSGPNDLLNSPVITSAVASSSTTTAVTVTLNSSPNTLFFIDLYRSTAPDAVAGEGQTYVQSVGISTDANGLLTTTFSIPSTAGAYYTATTVATVDSSTTRVRDTSEFSKAVAASAPPANPLVVTTTADAGAGSLRAAITYANAHTGAQAITFNIPAAQAANNVWTISPLTALPTLTGSNVTIDGATQTTFGGNTNAGGPEIVLHGGGTGFPGFTIQGSNNSIKNLVINNFAGFGVPDGIVLENAAADNSIQGCYIGTDATGRTAVPNQYGVFIRGTAHDNVIGGMTRAMGNIIAFNNYNGIIDSSSGRGNAFLGNNVFSNGVPQRGLGIDLTRSSGAGDGVTANDFTPTPDGDTGPNNLQNFPDLTVSINGVFTNISGTLTSTPSTSFHIEYFESPQAGVLGYGEGRYFLGFQNVTTDGTGRAANLAFQSTSPAGSYITATATRNAAPLDTSEFSRAVQIVQTATLRADYRFANVLTSSVGTPPALTKVGAGAFASEAVGSVAPTRVYKFDDNAGLQLSPAMPTLGSGTYTLALIARLDDIYGYNRLVDLKNATSDSGFYVYNGVLDLFPDGSGSSPALTANKFYQWVFTRDTAGTTRGYVNGVLSFSFSDTNGDGALSAANILRLFADDTAVSSEASPGAISRFRVWDGALSAAQVAALDGNPQYADTLSISLNPTSIAENAGSGASTATVIRTGPLASALTLTVHSNDTSEATVPASGTVVIPAGAASVTFPINAVDDSIADGPQTVRIVVGASGFTAVSADLTVMDNDVVSGSGVLAWGYNSYGQLGDGSTTHRSRPVIVGTYGAATTLAAGGGHSLTAASGGAATAAGYNAAGQVGDGTVVERNAPVTVAGLTGIRFLAAGWYHSVALLNDGTVYAWGYNASGEVGDGSKTNRATPVRVPGLTNVIAVAAGTYHSAALKADGSVWTWGNNYYGQLGDGTTNDRAAPVRAQLPAATAIACGGAHTLAVVGGKVYAWGWNSDGQLGNGTRTAHSLPAVVGNISGASRVAAGYIHSMALVGTTVVEWGDNALGQIGNNTTTDALTPANAQITNVADIAAGGAHSLALRTDRTLWAWGNNTYGGLGDNTTTNHPLPQQVPGVSAVTSFSGGYAHTLAIGNYTTPLPPPGQKATNALSSVAAYSANGTIALGWMTPLNARIAGNGANYGATVNGRMVTLSVQYSATTNTTTISVVGGLRRGEVVAVSWHGLAKANGDAVKDGTTQVTAR